MTDSDPRRVNANDDETDSVTIPDDANDDDIREIVEELIDEVEELRRDNERLREKLDTSDPRQ
jgi:hypothetical protein